MQFKLNLNYLKALNFINAKKDVRYYLNGVYFEISEKGLYLVATNGFIFDNYSDVIAYESFIRKITGYFLAITEIKTK